MDLKPLVTFATGLDISPSGDLFMTTSNTGGAAPVYELLLQMDADGKLKHVWPNGARIGHRPDRRPPVPDRQRPGPRHPRRSSSRRTDDQEPDGRRDRPVTGKSVSVGTTDLASVPVDRIVDPGLLARAAAGEVAAFDEILRPRLARLYRMAVAITRSEPDARDAVQDASLNAWRELPRLRSPERFDSWLDQILVNACRSLMRRSRRVVVREIDLETAGAGDDASGFGSAPDPDATEVDLIRRAFDRLEPGVRSLLVLHYVEERPLGEIARVMGSPVGTIKWRLSNARKALNRALEAERR